MWRTRMFWNLFLTYSSLWLGVLVVLGFVLHAQDPSAPFLLPLAWAGSISTLAAFLVAWWLSRHLTHSLEEVTRATEQLANGGLRHKRYAHRNGRTRRLSRALNPMSRR